jgi:uncharacterized protein
MLFAALLLAGCRGVSDGQDVADQVPVQVTNVGFDRTTGTHYVLLEDKAGKRELPIMIGDDEARAIMFELRGIKLERPLTYELLRNVIRETGNQVDHVVIADLRNEIYYARICLDRGRYMIDSRPSDAIALAVGANAPVFVSAKLLKASSQKRPGVAAALRTANALGMTVQELTPDLAQYFGVNPNGGVVVADLGPGTDKAGIKRGDIISEVGGRAVSTLDEFSQNAAAASAAGNSNVTLKIRRGDTTRVITVAAGAKP